MASIAPILFMLALLLLIIGLLAICTVAVVAKRSHKQNIRTDSKHQGTENDFTEIDPWEEAARRFEEPSDEPN